MTLTCPGTFTTPLPNIAKNSFMEDVEGTTIVLAALTTVRKSAKVGIPIGFLNIFIILTDGLADRLID